MHGIFTSALIASVLGGILWLDRYQFPQMMLSRPLVSSSIIGMALGDAEAGLSIGILFELLWYRRPPIGGFIPPDAVFASLAASSIAAIVRHGSEMPLFSLCFLVFVLFFPLAYLGTRIDSALRISLGGLAVKAIQGKERITEGGIDLTIAKALLTGFCAAALPLFPIIILGSFLIMHLTPFIPANLVKAFGFAYYIVPIAAAADIMAGFDERRYYMLFVIGFVVSVVGMALFR
jgi:mannose/fructose/N-acetylgalactosamine-specific phosphotransferase system component IIC